MIILGHHCVAILLAKMLIWAPFSQLMCTFSFCISPCLQTPTPTVVSAALFLWLNGWWCHIWCAVLLNDNMDLHMSSLGTIVPEGPWCVFYATGHQIYVGLTCNVFFTGTLIWYHMTNTTHTHAHTQHTLNNSLISKIYFPQCLLKNHSL